MLRRSSPSPARLLLGAALLLAACGRTESLPEPGSAGVEILPAEPTSFTDLLAVLTDPADHAHTYAYAWYIDGELRSDLVGARVPASETVRGQVWRVELTPVGHPGTEERGKEGPSASAETSILNAAPTATVRLYPDEVYSDTPIQALVDTYDPDGDPVFLTYTWRVEGMVVGGSSETLDPSWFGRGDTVEVEVVPRDEEDVGPPVTAETVVLNRPPSATVWLTPTNVRTDGVLTANVETEDLDGDAVTVTYAWFVDGEPISHVGSTLAGDPWFSKGQSVRVQVTPYDGLDHGEPALSPTVVVQNTPPTRPEVEISPSNPDSGLDLLCEITEESEDADDDPVAYSFYWARNGSVYSGSVSTTYHTGDTVPASATSHGDSWTCQVVPHDGESSGPFAASTVNIGSWAGLRSFSTCGASGRVGPTQATCDAAYNDTILAGGVQVIAGVQLWQVPTTGWYQIEAVGARGASADPSFEGGRGARMRGNFYLEAGEVLQIAVGQQGSVGGGSGGGGGATWVVDFFDEPLLVAGGGGGTRTDVSQDGCDAAISQFGRTASGSATTWSCAVKSEDQAEGGRVSAESWGSAGGGYLSAGQGDSDYGSGGQSWYGGLRGGNLIDCGSTPAVGGFGGGGSGNGCNGGGGGGGFSGGDGGRVAGGGGSYNGGSSQSNSVGVGTGHGWVTIDMLLF